MTIPFPFHKLPGVAAWLALALTFATCPGTASAGAADAPGPYPAAMIWSEEDRASQRAAGEDMLERIAEQARQGIKHIQIPKGDYRFANQADRKTHIQFTRFNDLEIDFQGSTLWFETEVTGITLTESRNVTLRNVVLDWDPLPFIQGTVTAIHRAEGPYRRFTSSFDFRLDPGYERTVPGMAPGNEEKYQQRHPWMVMTFDPETRQLKPGVIRVEARFRWSDRQPNGDHRAGYHGYGRGDNIPPEKSGMAVGDLIALVPRFIGMQAVLLANSHDTVLEDVTLHASPFLGFHQVIGGKATFRRCHILLRPGTNRLIAGNADGINLNSPGEGPLIEDCRMETLGDDFINVHGTFARVLWQESPTELIVTQMNSRRDTFSQPVEVEFLDRKTMRKLGKRLVTGKFISEWRVPEKGTDRFLADLGHRWHSGFPYYNAYGQTRPVHRLVLDAPLEIPFDTIIACDSRSGGGAVIRGCDLRGTYANGIRIQTGPARIENNRIAHVATFAIRLMGYPDYWGEGPYPHSVVIENNRFEDCTLGGARNAGGIYVCEGDAPDYEKVQPVPYDIAIRNNTFLRTGGPAVIARGVDGLEITGNRIEEYGTIPPRRPVHGYGLSVERSLNVNIDGNTFLRPGPHALGEIMPDDPARQSSPEEKIGGGL